MGQEEENNLKRKADVPMEVVMADDEESAEEENAEEEEEADRRFLGFLYGIENLDARDPRLDALNRQFHEMLTRLEQGVVSMRLEVDILNNIAENQQAAAIRAQESADEGENQQNEDKENAAPVGEENGNENDNDENDSMDD